MLKNITILLALAVALVSCSEKSNKVATADVAQQFGAPTTAKGAITYPQLMDKMKSIDSLNVKVTGTVGEVCQVKGCWMTIVGEKSGQPDMRVRFKDYAFFMPKDLSGKKVVIDGFAKVETTSVAELRHYAEDAGKSKAEIEKITQPLRELTFEAAGVLVLK